jgi:hypothetical protein
MIRQQLYLKSEILKGAIPRDRKLHTYLVHFAAGKNEGFFANF